MNNYFTLECSLQLMHFEIPVMCKHKIQEKKKKEHHFFYFIYLLFIFDNLFLAYLFIEIS